MFRRGIVARDPGELGINGVSAEAPIGGRKLRKESGASHALALLIELDEGAGPARLRRHDLHRHRRRQGHASRAQARLVGGRDWVRAGAAELGLDCLRRHLLGLPVDERIDFERR